MRVKIREDLNFDMKNVVSGMLKYAGKEGEVIETKHSYADGEKCYILDIDEGIYSWYEWMVEPIEKENDIKVKFKVDESEGITRLKIEEIKDDTVNLPIDENDNVNHPSHYTDSKIEVMDYIEDKQLNFARGNVIKYVSRAGKKDPTKEIEDLSKAAWYLNREIERLKGLNN